MRLPAFSHAHALHWRFRASAEEALSHVAESQRLISQSERLLRRTEALVQQDRGRRPDPPH